MIVELHDHETLQNLVTQLASRILVFGQNIVKRKIMDIDLHELSIEKMAGRDLGLMPRLDAKPKPCRRYCRP